MKDNIYLCALLLELYRPLNVLYIMQDNLERLIDYLAHYNDFVAYKLADIKYTLRTRQKNKKQRNVGK